MSFDRLIVVAIKYVKKQKKKYRDIFLIRLEIIENINIFLHQYIAFICFIMQSFKTTKLSN